MVWVGACSYITCISSGNLCPSILNGGNWCAQICAEPLFFEYVPKAKLPKKGKLVHASRWEWKTKEQCRMRTLYSWDRICIWWILQGCSSLRSISWGYLQNLHETHQGVALLEFFPSAYKVRHKISEQSAGKVRAFTCAFDFMCMYT
jgi:hypothetical protein